MSMNLGVPRITRVAPIPIGAWILTLFVTCGAGCGEGTRSATATRTNSSKPRSSPNVEAPSPSAATSSPSTPAGGPIWATKDRSALFDWARVPQFDLTLPSERWVQLQRDARDEEYVEATLEFEGEPIGTVGLRFKGYATLSYCFDGDEMICDKLSMKLRFDEYDEKLRFFGLKRLVLNSMHFDGSQLHERLAYDLYRSVGVVAPRAAWATLAVNGESYGLFSMVEPVDGRFTDDRWPQDGNGNLYKEAWPSFGGQSYYTQRLETNKTTADHRALDAFHTELAAAATPETRHQVLEKWIDIDSAYRYLAVDDAINAADGVTTFYADAKLSWMSNHNVFLYQETLRDRFTLIPWDLDNSFWTANLTEVPHWSQPPADCSRTYDVNGSDVVRVAPGCDSVFQGLAFDLTKYRDAVEELLNGPFTEASMSAQIDQWAQFLADSIEQDPFLDPATVMDRIGELRSNIPVLRARLEALRDNVPVAPVWLQRDSLNSFDSVTAIDARLGIAVSANAASTASVGVTAGESGASDVALHLEFQYRDDPKPYSHYAVYYLPIDPEIQDFSNRQGLRFRVRSNVSRNLRLEIVSHAHDHLGTYIYEGWNVPLSKVWQTVEVRFDTATLPHWATEQDLASQNPLVDVLRDLQQVRLYADCVGRNTSGFLGSGKLDDGFMDIDDIEFF